MTCMHDWQHTVALVMSNVLPALYLEHLDRESNEQRMKLDAQV